MSKDKLHKYIIGRHPKIMRDMLPYINSDDNRKYIKGKFIKDINGLLSIKKR